MPDILDRKPEEYLEPQDNKIWNKVLDLLGIDYIDAYYMFWSREEIQIDGNLSLKEMQAFTFAMEIMQDQAKGII